MSDTNNTCILFNENKKRLLHFIYTDYIKNGLRTVDLRNVSIDSRNSETNNKHSSNNYVLYEIVEKAFSNDTTLQRIILPKTIMTIEQSAFENCSELQIVEKDTEDTESELCIQYRAFKNCQKLHSFVICQTKNVVIESEAFSGCFNLRTVRITGEANISDSAFEGCDKDKLCFVCKKNSSVAKYAREHGYRYVNV